MSFSETEIAKIKADEVMYRVTHESTRMPNKNIGRLYKMTDTGWTKLEEWEPEIPIEAEPHIGNSDWAEKIREEAKEEIKYYNTAPQEVIKTNDPINER